MVKIGVDRIPYNDNAKHKRGAVGRGRGQEVCSRPEEETHTCAKTRRVQSRKSAWKNAARFAYGTYERFRMKGQSLTAAVDLENAYNTAPFIPLRERAHRLVGLVVKASTSRAENTGFVSLAKGFLLGRVIPVT